MDRRKSRWISAHALVVTLALTLSANLSAVEHPRLVELGRYLFQDKALSRDHKTSCSSCHDAAHAYADPHPRSAGVESKIGTRNAPSLAGIADDATFFWDGRRDNLEDVVLDPFTNPVELGLASVDAALEQLRDEPDAIRRFRGAFPDEHESPTRDQVRRALATFVRSLSTGHSAYDQLQTHPAAFEVKQGFKLFEGVAGCTTCHTTTGNPARFSDGLYHHAGVGEATRSERLPELAKDVVGENLSISALGPKLLTDADWSALGRFAVTHNPADIGAFRTPSLRNVAITAPYMHDGSIATLTEAVDHEIYYRGVSSGRPINLTQAERRAIVAFLESLTDAGYGSTDVRR